MAKDYTKLMDAPYAILAQFQKDFSFENPGIMNFLTGGVKTEPKHNMDWNLSFSQLQDNDFEVVMKMNLTAKIDEQTLYMIETEYGAIVRINEKHKNMTQPIISAEVPTQIYPFLRSIIAQAVADGGYPPILLPPIDFHGHFIQKVKEFESQQKTAKQAGSDNIVQDSNGKDNGATTKKVAKPMATKTKITKNKNYN